MATASPGSDGANRAGAATFQISTRDGVNGAIGGDVYRAELRDGIDGPVVYRFDAADVLASVV